MVFFHHISGLGVLLVATVALAAPATLKQPSEFQVGLNVAAKAAKKLYFGTATNADQWNDTTYFDILRSAEFGQITAANVMKWVREAFYLRAVHILLPSPRSRSPRGGTRRPVRSSARLLTNFDD